MNSSFAAFDFAIMSPAHSRSRAVCFVAFAIIGLCVAGSKRKAIAKAVETNGLAYPICIDSAQGDGWGLFIRRFAVRAILETFVIGKDGRVVAHGGLEDMPFRAEQLASP